MSLQSLNDLYADFEDQAAGSSSAKRKADDIGVDPDEPQEKKPATNSVEADACKANGNRIYVGSLAPNVTEDMLSQYFVTFGEIANVRIIRDRNTGISKGFAFVTFKCDASADTAIKVKPHLLDGKAIRVCSVMRKDELKSAKSQESQDAKQILESIVLPSQARIYIGPLEDSWKDEDILRQFEAFGRIKHFTRLRVAQTQSKIGYGFIDYGEAGAVRRSFGSRLFIKGKHIKISLSRFALEIAMNPSTMYFFEAHLRIEDNDLEAHFSRFGQVYRCCQFLDADGEPKPYGFVDFVSTDSAEQAVLERPQLIPPGQYAHVSKLLPLPLLLDMFAMSDMRGNELMQKLDRTILYQGTFGSSKQRPHPSGSQEAKVKIPKSMIYRLLGERGKVLTEISRDSNTRITLPKVDDGQDFILLTVSGTKENIKIAQYLMKKKIQG